MNEMNYPELEGLTPELQAEWHRVADQLLHLGLVSEKKYPNIRSVRRDQSAGLGKVIDHTLLKQSAGSVQYQELCDQAREWGTYSVCVPGSWVPLATERLHDSGVAVCSVAGFPFGYDSTAAKVAEARYAISHGASEIDMVLNLGLVKDDNLQDVFQDISEVVKVGEGILIKVILETSELSPIEILRAGTLACFAGAHFIKTSTGFASGGAGVEALKIMRHVAGPLRGVKASGGVRTREFALECLEIGVDRIGSSSAAAILGLEKSVSGGY